MKCKRCKNNLIFYERILSTKQFYWYKEDSSFSQEASFLGIPAGSAIDKINLINPNTGNTIAFYRTVTLKNDSGEEIGGWLYSCKEFPKMRLTIWND